MFTNAHNVRTSQSRWTTGSNRSNATIFDLKLPPLSLFCQTVYIVNPPKATDRSDLIQASTVQTCFSTGRVHCLSLERTSQKSQQESLFKERYLHPDFVSYRSVIALICHWTASEQRNWTESIELILFILFIVI